MTDQIGIRMKEQYEDRTRYLLPRRTYTIIRCDGKAFHTLTRGFKKPYDETLAEVMDNTAIALCKEIQGVSFAYVQSDEISLLLTDFKDITTQAWFDGNIQKMVSVSASVASAYFNSFIKEYSNKLAFFDSRVFTIPDSVEVENYFVWRQQDAVRNSIQMLAQSLYSQKELMNKNTSELQELCFQKEKNWNDVAEGFKRGRFITKEYYKKDDVLRTMWTPNPAFHITKERERFSGMIPVINQKEIAV